MDTLRVHTMTVNMTKYLSIQMVKFIVVLNVKDNSVLEWEQYLKIVKRENKNLSLLILDLDDFKKINDTFGHEIGDLVIKQLVEIAKNSIRKNDLIVRFGGDEFIILLPNTQIEQAKTVALKIIDKIDEYNKDKEFNFTISVGVSSYQKGDETIDNLISRADDALYEAKTTGKNKVCTL